MILFSLWTMRPYIKQRIFEEWTSTNLLFSTTPLIHQCLTALRNLLQNGKTISEFCLKKIKMICWKKKYHQQQECNN